MKPRISLRAVILSLCLASALSAQPAATGSLQVQGEPGLQIYLDEQLQGITAPEAGGLLLPKVPAGKHKLKAVKPGFAPKTIPVVIKAGEARIIKLPPLTARSKSMGDKSAQLSVLYVFLPELHLAADILVTLDDKTFAALSKSQFCVRREIPAGSHTALGDIRPFPAMEMPGRFRKFPSGPPTSPPPLPTKLDFNSAAGEKLYLRIEAGPVVEQGLQMGLVPEADAKAYTQTCLEAKPTSSNPGP
jgi:hypothetical protein